MNYKIWSIATLFLCLHFFPLTALADTIYLKNGKTITVEKAWQEDDQVCFIFSDMQASIPQSKVTRIECDSGDTGKSNTMKNHDRVANKISDPQPAEDIQPDSINQTAETASTAPQPAKTLALRTDGFGGLRWGARVTNISGLEKIQTESGLKDVVEYVRPDDTLKFEELNLKSIVYAFWRDELYTVTVWTQGLSNYKALHQNVVDQFGNGSRPDSASEKYLWSDGPSDIMLKYEKDGQYGMLWMRCKELDRKFKLSKLNGHTSYLKWMKSRN